MSNEWIKCSDRLPDTEVMQIAYDEFYGTVGEALFLKEQKSWCFTGQQQDDCNVTHWQPLPEPPKEQDDVE